MIPIARPNHGAGRIDQFREELHEIIKPVLLSRVAGVDNDEYEATSSAFDEFVEWWSDEAEAHGGLLYEPQRGSKTPSLLSSFDDESNTEAWATLWSLRDVDAESVLFLEASR